jgi:hypothetical protein
LDLVSAAAAGQPVKQFPTVASAVLLQAQTKHIAFQNGTGIRAVVMKGQVTHFAHSEAVYYEFHGVSADGLVYLVLAARLDHPLLLDNFEANLNGRHTALPPPDLSLVIDDDDAFYGAIRKYNAAVAAHFEMAQPGDFVPDLSLLDQLVASLLVRPTGTILPGRRAGHASCRSQIGQLVLRLRVVPIPGSGLFPDQSGRRQKALYRPPEMGAGAGVLIAGLTL